MLKYYPRERSLSTPNIMALFIPYIDHSGEMKCTCKILIHKDKREAMGCCLSPAGDFNVMQYAGESYVASHKCGMGDALMFDCPFKLNLRYRFNLCGLCP